MSANLAKVVQKLVKPLEERIAALEALAREHHALLLPCEPQPLSAWPGLEPESEMPKKRKPRTKTRATE